MSVAERHPSEARITAVAALDQPLRRALHKLLADRPEWMGRDDAARALDIPRSVAAFHLDKLAEAGVVEVRFERTSGRRGPGAGRPSKLYRLADDEIVASVPERHYDLAASLLAAAVAESARTGAPVRECLHEVARDAGREAGSEAALVEVLDRHGYEPETDGREIALANCPFHRLADEQRDLVCGMNLDFLSGVLESVDEGGGSLSARLDPVPGYCCVRISRR